MRKLLFITLFAFICNFTQAQSMSSYFRNEGVKTLALLAHPSNTFKTGNYEIYSNKVSVRIIYEDYETVLEVKRSGSIFSDIRVINDNDWVAPFEGIQFIKDIAYEAFNDDNEKKNRIEAQMGKAFADMTGTEMACLILTLEWWNY